MKYVGQYCPFSRLEILFKNRCLTVIGENSEASASMSNGLHCILHLQIGKMSEMIDKRIPNTATKTFLQ